MVQIEDNIVGLDSAIFTHPKVWEASGHVSGFSDPLVECKNCHTRSRADHLLEHVGAFADEKMTAEEINKIFDAHRKDIACPKCGKKDFTEVRTFNLLVQSNLGNFSGDWTKEPTYLRGETCQGIYLNFKNVLDTTRVKVPISNCANREGIQKRNCSSSVYFSTPRINPNGNADVCRAGGRNAFL